MGSKSLVGMGFGACRVLTMALIACAPNIAAAADRQPFADAPELWRGYLLKAKAAEALPDPLQRCLAYPDLPGVAWPEGHSAAHCRLHYPATMTLADIGREVRSGNLSKLETAFSMLLERHFSEPSHDERIHDLVLAFDASAESDAISTEWLAKAPQSAYANIARGIYLSGKAGQARGGEYVRNTPRENMERMSALFAEAMPLLRKSAQIEPRMMPAYVALLHIGIKDSNDSLKEQALKAGYEHDPGCMVLNDEYMAGLQPRWGGSYAEMEAFADKLRPKFASRPLLPLIESDIHYDMGRRLKEEDLYGQAGAALEAAIAISSNEEALSDAATVAATRPGEERDKGKALVYLLQFRRFQPGGYWEASTAGHLLVEADEPQWAIGALRHALTLKPDSGYAHYWIAAAYYNSSQQELADQHYRKALQDSDHSLDAAQEGAEMWVQAHKPAKAEYFTDVLASRYPENAYGRYLRMWQKIMSTKRYDEAELRRFVKETDPAQDHRLTGAIDKTKQLLAEMERLKAAGPAGSGAK